ncbi:MAG: hypothetical protein HQL82_15590 [Magnetococcales bacterium]|nr:hypothetical protein [Magnetococcales bacterium]
MGQNDGTPAQRDAAAGDGSGPFPDAPGLAAFYRVVRELRARKPDGGGDSLPSWEPFSPIGEEMAFFSRPEAQPPTAGLFDDLTAPRPDVGAEPALPAGGAALSFQPALTESWPEALSPESPESPGSGAEEMPPGEAPLAGFSLLWNPEEPSPEPEETAWQVATEPPATPPSDPAAPAEDSLAWTLQDPVELPYWAAPAGGGGGPTVPDSAIAAALAIDRTPSPREESYSPFSDPIFHGESLWGTPRGDPTLASDPPDGAGGWPFPASGPTLQPGGGAGPGLTRGVTLPWQPPAVVVCRRDVGGDPNPAASAPVEERAPPVVPLDVWRPVSGEFGPVAEPEDCVGAAALTETVPAGLEQDEIAAFPEEEDPEEAGEFGWSLWLDEPVSVAPVDAPPDPVLVDAPPPPMPVDESLRFALVDAPPALAPDAPAPAIERSEDVQDPGVPLEERELPIVEANIPWSSASWVDGESPFSWQGLEGDGQGPDPQPDAGVPPPVTGQAYQPLRAGLAGESGYWLVPVETLGSGLVNALGDMVGFVIHQARRMQPRAIRKIMAKPVSIP